MKKFCAVILCICLTVTLLCGCGGITLPDLAGTDLASAKTILTQKGLIPVVEEQEDENVAEGVVIGTKPAAGESVAADTSVTILVSSGAGIIMPAVVGKTEEEAVKLVRELGIEPKMEYEFSDDYDEGIVSLCNRPANMKLHGTDSVVRLTVSKGPWVVESQNSNMTWWNLGNGQDKWEFYNPTIDRDSNVLRIKCYNVVIQKSFEWQDPYESGYGNGVACLNDSFDKTVPIKIDYFAYDNGSYAVKAGEPFAVVIEIPLNELEVERPTDIYMEISICENHTDTNNTKLKLRISMTW